MTKKKKVDLSGFKKDLEAAEQILDYLETWFNTYSTLFDQIEAEDFVIDTFEMISYCNGHFGCREFVESQDWKRRLQHDLLEHWMDKKAREKELLELTPEERILRAIFGPPEN